MAILTLGNSNSVFSGSFQGDGSALTGLPSVDGTLIASGSVTASTDPATGFVVKASGSTLLDVQGSLGSMFSVSDSFDGNLFEVNNISGISLLNVSSSGNVDIPKGVLTVSGSVSASKFLGDGSALTGVGGDAFPFTGDAQITGSLNISGSTTISTGSLTLGTGSLSVTGSVSFQASSGGTVFSIGPTGSFTLGEGATTTLDSQVAIGYNATANSSFDISIGGNSNATGGNSVAIGRSANAGADGIAIGVASAGANGVAMGQSSAATGNGVSIGYDSETPGSSISLGANAKSSGANSITLNANGSATSTSTANALKVFITSNSTPDFEITNTHITASGNISGSSISTSSFGTYLGDGSQLTGISTTPFPFTGDAQITGSLIVSGAVEFRGVEDFDSNVVIGKNATSTSQDSVVIGEGAGISAGGSKNVVIGRSANLSNNSLYNVVIGEGAYGSGAGSIAIGMSSITSGEGIAIGRSANVSGYRGIAIGTGATAGLNQLSIGDSTNGTLISASLATGHIILSGSTGGLELIGSGSTMLEIIGSEGTLFSVDDDLDGTIFTANDASGLPILQADSTGEVYLGKSPQSLYTTKQIASTVSTHTESIYQIDTSSLFTSAVFDYTCVSQSNATAGQIRSVWVPGTDLISFTDTALNGIGSIANLHLSVEFTQSKASFLSKTDSAGWRIKSIIRSI